MLQGLVKNLTESGFSFFTIKIVKGLRGIMNLIATDAQMMYCCLLKMLLVSNH